MREIRRHQAWSVAALLVLFVAPLLGLLLQSVAAAWRFPDLLPTQLGLRGFQVAFGTGQAGRALINSLVVALVTTALALALAWPAARVLAQVGRRWRTALLLVLAAPLLVPPLATGTGLTEWMIRLGLTGTRTGVVLAHLTVVLPYVLLILQTGFGGRLRELEEMAGSAGMGPARRLVLVSIPSLRGVIAAAALLGFLVSWSQYGSSLAVGAGLPLLPLVLVPYIGSDPTVAAALSVLFLLPALAALALALRVGREAL